MKQSVESADKNFIGLRETTRPAGELLRLIVRPQEVVQAIAAMETAYEQYAFAIGEYNTAQFDLYRALGQPAQWVTCSSTSTIHKPAGRMGHLAPAVAAHAAPRGPRRSGDAGRPAPRADVTVVVIGW